MKIYYLRCRSVTYAQRASKALERAGIPCSIVKLPHKLSEEGCGYSLRVTERFYKNASSLLKNAGFDIVKAYASDNNSDFTEVQL